MSKHYIIGDCLDELEIVERLPRNEEARMDAIKLIAQEDSEWSAKGQEIEGVTAEWLRDGEVVLQWDVDADGEVLASVTHETREAIEALEAAVGKVRFLDRGERAGEEVYVVTGEPTDVQKEAARDAGEASADAVIEERMRDAPRGMVARARYRVEVIRALLEEGDQEWGHVDGIPPHLHGVLVSDMQEAQQDALEAALETAEIDLQSARDVDAEAAE